MNKDRLAWYCPGNDRYQALREGRLTASINATRRPPRPGQLLRIVTFFSPEKPGGGPMCKRNAICTGCIAVTLAERGPAGPDGPLHVDAEELARSCGYTSYAQLRTIRLQYWPHRQHYVVTWELTKR